MPERFELARAIDLQPPLAVPDGKNSKLRKAALRKVVSNMIVNNPEMLNLYPEVLHNIQSNDSEIKRMCFLYLETYVKSRPQHLTDTLNKLSAEVLNDQSPPGIRAAALRTLSNVPSKTFAVRTLELVPEGMTSNDAYFRKTAAFAVAKAWTTSHSAVESSGVLGRLNQVLIKESSPVVVAAAAQSLLSITESSPDMEFVIDFPTARRLASLLSDCPEYSQISLLTAISNYVPQSSEDAEDMFDLVVPGLRHTNAAVAVGTARVLMMLSHYSTQLSQAVTEQIFGPLLSQLNRPAEIQYSVLRNIELLLQTSDPDTLKRVRIPPQTFFCKSSDMPYIRSTKIDILGELCTPSNAEMVIKELIEFVNTPGDAAAQRKAVFTLAKLAAKYEEVAPQSVKVLKRTIQKANESSRASTDVEETAISALIQLVRRYPENRSLVEEAVSTLLKIEDPPRDEEAKSLLVWLWGSYATSSSAAIRYLADIIATFKQESPSVQLSLLTACVKVFLRVPQEARVLIPQVFEVATSQSANPDIRDRALFYWRLVSQNPSAATNVVAAPLPAISKYKQPYDYSQLEDLELSMGYLSSIYLKPADQLFRVAHPRQLRASPALLPRKFNKLQELAPDEPTSSVNRAQRLPQPQRTVSTDSMPFPMAPNRTSMESTPFPRPQRTISTDSMPFQHFMRTSSSGYSPTPPPPPAPRTRSSRQTSLSEQFQGFQLSPPPPPDDQNERLIDI